MSTARAVRPLRRHDVAEPAVDRRRRRAHLTVVDAPPEPRRRSRGPAVAIAAGLVIVFLALFGLVAFHTVLVQNQSQIDELDERLAAEREVIEQARLEIAELEAPERVIAEAEALGLIAPDEVVMLDAVELDSPPAPGAAVPGGATP